jgi:hypothetical protein
MRDLLTTAQVAERQQVSVRVARRWLREMQVPPVRVGGCIRYRPVDVEGAEARAVEMERQQMERPREKKPVTRIPRAAKSKGFDAKAEYERQLRELRSTP